MKWIFIVMMTLVVSGCAMQQKESEVEVSTASTPEVHPDPAALSADEDIELYEGQRLEGGIIYNADGSIDTRNWVKAAALVDCDLDLLIPKSWTVSIYLNGKESNCRNYKEVNIYDMGELSWISINDPYHSNTDAEFFSGDLVLAPHDIKNEINFPRIDGRKSKLVSTKYHTYIAILGNTTTVNDLIYTSIIGAPDVE